MRGNVKEVQGTRRSKSIVPFNEEGDYVPAAICRLETEDLVNQE